MQSNNNFWKLTFDLLNGWVYKRYYLRVCGAHVALHITLECFVALYSQTKKPGTPVPLHNCHGILPQKRVTIFTTIPLPRNYVTASSTLQQTRRRAWLMMTAMFSIPMQIHEYAQPIHHGLLRPLVVFVQSVQALLLLNTTTSRAQHQTLSYVSRNDQPRPHWWDYCHQHHETLDSITFAKQLAFPVRRRILCRYQPQTLGFTPLMKIYFHLCDGSAPAIINYLRLVCLWFPSLTLLLNRTIQLYPCTLATLPPKHAIASAVPPALLKHKKCQIVVVLFKSTSYVLTIVLEPSWSKVAKLRTRSANDQCRFYSRLWMNRLEASKMLHKNNEYNNPEFRQFCDE